MLPSLSLFVSSGLGPLRVGQAPRLSKLAEVLGGFAPCVAERLCLSGRDLRNIIVFRRVKAQPSRGRKQVVYKVAASERRSLSA